MEKLDNGVTVHSLNNDGSLKGEDLKKAQEAAVAKAEGKEVVAPSGDSSEAKIDWEKRYKDAQAELTRLQQAAKKTQETPAGEAKVGEAKETPAGDTPKEDSDPFKKFEQEYLSTGKLTEESYKELKDKHGLSQVAVNEIVEARKVKAQAVQEEVLSVISEDPTEAYNRYGEMLKWAKDAFSKEETATFNKLVTSGDPQMMKIGVKTLVDRYVAHRNGEDPMGNLQMGDQQGSGVSFFKDMDELRAAMKDPRMGKSPSYTKSVTDRIPKNW